MNVQKTWRWSLEGATRAGRRANLKAAPPAYTRRFGAPLPAPLAVGRVGRTVVIDYPLPEAQPAWSGGGALPLFEVRQ